MRPTTMPTTTVPDPLLAPDPITPLPVGMVLAGGVAIGPAAGWPDWLTLLAPGVVGLGIATYLLVGIVRRSTAGRRSRGAFAAGLALWSVGQIVVAVECLRDQRSLLSVGESLSLAGLAVGAAALAHVVGNSAFARPRLRLAIDGVMLGTTVWLLGWRWQFEVEPESGAIATTLLPSVVLAAIAVLLAVRRPSRRLAVFTTGLLIVLIGSVMSALSTIGGGHPSVLAAAMYCLGLPALTLLPKPRVDLDPGVVDVGADSRQAAVALGGTLAGAVTFVVVQFIDRHPATTAGSLLIALATGAFLVRQTLDHRQRSMVFDRLNVQVRTDATTQMGNRRVIEELDGAVRPFDLVVVGVDGVGRLSELHGHAAGDALLLAVAGALDDCVPDRLALARLDGHEFAIAVDADGPLESLTRRVQDRAEQAVLREQFAFGQRLVVSTGAARDDITERAALDTLARAQRARHVARQRDDRTLVFDADLRSREERLRLLDRRLPLALDNGLIGIQLQPIVDIHTRTVVGAEALARWTDDELGGVGPNEFVPRAEANGEVVRLGLAVLERAVAAARDLRFEASGRYVTVNVSAGQLRGIDDGGLRFTDHVAAVLGAHGVGAGTLVCEITESMLIVEDDPAVDEMRRLSELGVRIAIDDFGSGHWALAYLRWLPADVIKIDRGLIVAIDQNQRARDVVGSIVELARRIGASLVAEGVETEAIAQTAAALGVTLVQGWHFSADVPAGRFAEVADHLEATVPSVDELSGAT